MQFDRRSFVRCISTTLLSSALAPALSFADRSLLGNSNRTDESPIEILDLRVISWKAPLYHGWPTLARRANGELMLAFSGGRETHVCPFGRVEWMRSKDNGLTWSWPQVLYDGPIDDRDAGVLETPKGSLLVTTFTSLAYEPILQKAETAKPGQPGAFADPKLLLEWQAVHHRIDEAARKKELGCYMLRSTDGGVTWSNRYRVPCNSPHGPIPLADGRLLYAGKDLWGDDQVGLWHSSDDGLTWELLAPIPVRPGDSASNYHELHAVQAADGTIICHVRNHNKANANETLQCESTDGGRTWSMLHSIGVWGLPSHIMKMRSGRLVMTYGYRRKPLGNQMRFSDDHGKSWSDAVILSGDGVSGDLGYPSTIECDDGTMVTAWYEKLADSPLAQLRQARWKWR
jgi:hypothetical protein